MDAGAVAKDISNALKNTDFTEKEKSKILAYFTMNFELATYTSSFLRSLTTQEEQSDYLKSNLSKENIKKILDPYIIDPENSLCESITLFDGVPNEVSDISTYLKFVNREEEVKQLMKNMEYIYNTVNDVNQYSEPLKMVVCSTAVGTAGKGKTTFARRAYDNPVIYSDIVRSEVVKEINYYMLRNLLGNNITLEDILNVIMHYTDANKKPLFIINIDETNALFDNNDDIVWLKGVLRAIARLIEQKYFLFVVLTGTHARNLFKTVKSSGAKFEDISLPLLKPRHAEEVIIELANRKMGVIGSAAAFKTTTYESKFHRNGLRYFLEYCQHKPEYCQELLKRTKKHISRKYNHYFKHFAETNNLGLIPSLVAYTLFGWPVERTDEIDVNMKRKVEQINETNWNQFIQSHSNHSPQECIAYHNSQGASFADSLLLTDPPILIQDKQQIVSRKKIIDGKLPNMLGKGLVEKEHNKCKNIGKHIFVFVTDSKKRMDEIYRENVIVITEEEKKGVFGDLLALRALHCIERT
ncbi:18610_t:CDS:2 [Racocetra fulgida]|uniref:18610_t:CDS:1 n=1 Tax=Racocetra fulgida TaxID=60492 RepID=A0A9N9EAC5_9GLOM|nr:18610_t:CDS:2 [Racocetra fulgida]